jgi:hypothetical protein
LIPPEALVTVLAGLVGSIGSALIAAIKTRRKRGAAAERPPRSVVVEVEGRKVDLSGRSLAEQERVMHQLLTEPDAPADSTSHAETG